MQSKQILIKGAGEMASAVAHRLFRCGYSVVMADIAQPTAVRRRVSFCSAIYEGEIEIEGVKGIFNQAIGNEQWATRNGKRETGDNHISILIDPQCHIKNILKPDVIIDARLLKHNLDNHLTDAPLTIALGPGIEAGKDVHVVIETNRGHALGRIITKGFAEADTGNPGVIGGYSLERVFRAPAAGVFRSHQQIGNLVQSGDVLGEVAGQPITAKIAGVLRGLIMPGIEVSAEQKLGDIDPRGDVSYSRTISDKARTISGSVLEVVVSYENSCLIQNSQNGKNV